MSTEEPAIPSRSVRVALILLFAVSLSVMFVRMSGDALGAALDPLRINDDVLQHIPPLFRCVDPSLFPGDAIVDYYSAAILPVLFKGLYCALALVGLDPATTSAFLPVVLLVSLAICLGVAANRVGGGAAAWSTLALTLGSSVFLERLAGGLQRSFGFPIIALTLALLACGRTRWLGLVVILGAGLYPPAAFVVGVSLALVVLLPWKGLGGDVEDWSLRNRILFVLAVALAASLVIMPTVFSAKDWGPRLGPDRLADFPEIGATGRYEANDDRFVTPSLGDVGATVKMAIRGSARPWVDIPGAMSFLLLLSVPACVIVAMRNHPMRRMCVVLVAAFFCTSLSILFEPYLFLPQRFVLYPLVPFAMVAVGASVPAIAREWVTDERRKILLATLAAVAIVFLVGGRGDGASGVTRNLAPDEVVLRFIGALPPDTLVAGWPGGVIDLVPYAARRSALVTFETHQAFHEKYALEMRRRVNELVEVFYSSDPRSLSGLRDELGVDVLIVEPQRIYEPENPYFDPFDGEVAAARRRLGNDQPAVMNVDERSILYRDSRLTILDLRALSDEIEEK